jgi:asparagine synthase (glutamine-hydrolysing)
MSGLAGVFVCGGRPVDRSLFAQVVSKIAYRGRGGLTSWHAPGVSLACAKFIRTSDSAFDRQPLYDAASDTCVTFDGRLDNRAELAGLLDVPLDDELPDSQLAGAAYRRWGTDALVRLLGDFSLAIWDGRERRLLLARDIMGARPLFYRELNGAWWWASDQRALLGPGLPAINHGLLAEHLNGRIVSVDETVYEGVQRLPMAHALLIRPADTHRWRYWRPPLDARPLYRDPRDYVQHYRDLLQTSVRARLRTTEGAALLLSGGIDSTSIAREVAALRDDGVAAAADVQAFSMTVPDHAACERPVVGQVVDRLRLASVMLPAHAPSADDFAREAAASLDITDSPSAAMMRPLLGAVAASGRSVVLTGYGGDQWFDSSYGELADLLRSGRVFAALAWLASVDRISDYAALPQIVRQAAWMMTPPRTKDVVRRFLRRSPVSSWMGREFVRTHALGERLRQTPDLVPFGSLAQSALFRLATDGDTTFRGDIEERHMASLGLELWHPLMDRRMIELGLSLPPDLRWRRGMSKALMRLAAADALPAAVTRGARRDDFAFLGFRVLSSLGGVSRLLRAEPVLRGWVRADATRELYRALESGTSRALWPLCSITAIDFWLRALEGTRRGQSVRHYEQRTPHLRAS